MAEQLLLWLDGFFLPNWYWLLPANSFAEGIVVLSLAAPGLVTIALAGYYSGTGDLPLTAVIGLAFLGTVVGDLASYNIGRILLKRFATRSRLGREVEKMIPRFARRTLWFVPLYNFVAYGRAFGPAAYGALKTPFVLWLSLDVIGALIWCVTIALLGYGAGRSAEAIESSLDIPEVVEWIFLAVFLVWVVSLILGVWRIIRRVRDAPNELRDEP